VLYAEVGAMLSLNNNVLSSLESSLTLLRGCIYIKFNIVTFNAKSRIIFRNVIIYNVNLIRSKYVIANNVRN
jgi:hypothetical protein